MLRRLPTPCKTTAEFPAPTPSPNISVATRRPAEPEAAVKITNVQPIQADAAWAAYTFVKVETDAGITGYGECSDWRAPNAVAGGVLDMRGVVLDQDPMAVAALTAAMNRHNQQAPGGTMGRAIAGIECALWDIKGKAYGVPVYELFGGPFRDRVRLYWSHCSTYRARYSELLGTPPIRTYDDIADLGREVVQRGFTALKTNITIPGDPADVYATTDGILEPGILERITSLLDAFRAGTGDGFDLALDINYNFKTHGATKIAKALEPYDMMWLELDTWEPAALRQVTRSTSTTICSGESVNTLLDYRPFLEQKAMDVGMVDIPWTGFAQAKAIIDLAESHDIVMAPHNYYSHLSTFMAAHLCAATRCVQIMETDVDAAPWRDELFTEIPQIEDGYLVIPDSPGWGIDLNEEAIAERPWRGAIPSSGVLSPPDR